MYYFTDVWFVAVVGLMASCISSFATTFVKHRGVVHSIWFCFIYGFIIYLSLGMELAVLGVVGAYTHLLGDKLFFKLV